MQTLYLAGGCFWCMEKPYHKIPGVLSATSGYCGGTEVNPTYLDVKSQKTMHRETVEVVFDETKISAKELLKVYFESIDPFDAGGQFIDRGHSYTCAVYYTDDDQKELVTSMIEGYEKEFGQTICVSVEPYLQFYKAEEYHQDYANKNPQEYRHEYVISGREEYDKKRK